MRSKLGPALSIPGAAFAVLLALAAFLSPAFPAFGQANSPIKIAYLRDSNVWVMDPSGDPSSQQPLTSDGTAAYLTWSPDRMQIAYVSSRGGQWDLYVLHVTYTATGRIDTNPGSPTRVTETRLTQDAANEFQPEWSPDGSKIAFASNRDGNWEIYTIGVPAPGPTDPTRLTFNSVADTDPTWSPDGTMLAFREGSDLLLMSANGGASSLLWHHGGDWVYDLAWSPSAGPQSRIAFRSSADIWVTDILSDSTGYHATAEHRLTNTRSGEGNPSWSPDGLALAFVTDRDRNNNEIYAMDQNGGGQHNLTNSPRTDDRQPAWYR